MICFLTVLSPSLTVPLRILLLSAVIIVRRLAACCIVHVCHPCFVQLVSLSSLHFSGLSRLYDELVPFVEADNMESIPHQPQDHLQKAASPPREMQLWLTQRAMELEASVGLLPFEVVEKEVRKGADA